jgi:RHS repeat-associated protein
MANGDSGSSPGNPITFPDELIFVDLPSSDQPEESDFDTLAANIEAGQYSLLGQDYDVRRAVGLYISEYLDQDEALSGLPSDQNPATQDLQNQLGPANADAVNQAVDQLQPGGGGQYARETPNATTTTVADPVNLATGQFNQSVTDFIVAGAGMDFAFVRTYRSGALYQGPLGASWDHSANLWIYVNSTDKQSSLTVHTGQLRPIYYILNSNNDIVPQYYVAIGSDDVIVQSLDGAFEQQSPDGRVVRYENLAQDGILFQAKRITDRFGNFLCFDYTKDDNGNYLLLTVTVNNRSRIVQFNYDDQSRINNITLFPVTYSNNAAGPQRIWAYQYDDFCDLVAVTGPATDDFPAGRTTQYAYSSESSFATRQHDLLRITDPNGNTYLENEYGYDEGTVAYGRVVSQRVGSGVFLFEWEQVLQDPSWTYSDADCPTSCVTVVQRNGHSVHYVLNAMGNILVSWEKTLAGCGEDVIVWRYAYDDDGRRIATLSPEGRMTQVYYGRQYYYDSNYSGRPDDQLPRPWQDANLSQQEHASFSNVLAIVQRAGLFDFSTLTDDLTIYDDIFPDVLAPPEGGDIIVKYSYEPTFQQWQTVSDPRYTTTADPDGPASPAYATVTFNNRARDPEVKPAAITYPITTYPKPLPDGTTQIVNPALTFDAYDANGRLLQYTKPERNVFASSYFPRTARQPTIEGFLASQTVAAGTLNLATRFAVNEAGQITAVTDPRNNTTQFGIDPCSLVRIVTSPIAGYSVTSKYDGNAQLISRSTAIIEPDGSTASGSPEITNYAYNTEMSRVLTSFGDSSGTPLRQTRRVYDPANCLIRLVMPRGNSICYEYDERLLLKRMTWGCCAPEAATTLYEYDLDGLLVAVTDSRGGQTISTLDGFGRAIGVTDPLGTLQRIDYDKLNNVIFRRWFGAPSNGTYPLLRRTEYQYDERNQLNRERKCVFSAPIPAADPWNAPDAEYNVAVLAGKVQFCDSLTFRDGNLRIFRLVDANGNPTTMDYDDADRCYKITDPTRSFKLVTYYPPGNVVRADRYCADAGGVVRAVFSTLYEFDALNRLVATIDGAGNRVEIGLDSRNLPRTRTDALGHVTEWAYNPFRDRIAETQILIQLGGGPPVGLTTALSYDSNSNVVSVTDPRGNATTLQYDLLDRMIRATNVDGTYRTIAYDRSGNRIQLVDEDGVVVNQTFDPANNKTGMTVRSGGTSPVSAEQIASFSYDGLRRLITHENPFVKGILNRDSLGRCFEETLTYGPLLASGSSSLTLMRQFDAVSNLIQLQHPSGQALSYDYDAANRLTAINSTANATGYPGDSTAPADRQILQKTWWGNLCVGTQLGNGVPIASSFDAAGRAIASGCNLNNGDTFQLQQLWDGAGNRRLVVEKYRRHVQGWRYDYDSTNRLLNPPALNAPVIVPVNTLAPPTSPLASSALRGQTAIDAVISGYTTRPSAGPEYSYDAAGNRTSQDSVSYTTNTRNEYTLVGTTPLAYNHAGRLISDANCDYAYNMRGQLVQATSQTTRTIVLQVFHDALGRPIGTVEGVITRMLVPNGGNAVESYDNGVLSAVYVREGRDRLSFFATGGKDQYVLRDVLESTRLTTDTKAAAIAVFHYDPFGQLPPGTPSSPILYAGKHLYDSIRWYEYQRRQYIPAIGRFAQPDPAGFIDGPNLYSFVGNNPLSARDPNGTNRQNVPPAAQTQSSELKNKPIPTIDLGEMTIVGQVPLNTQLVGYSQQIPSSPVPDGSANQVPHGGVEADIGASHISVSGNNVTITYPVTFTGGSPADIKQYAEQLGKKWNGTIGRFHVTLVPYSPTSASQSTEFTIGSGITRPYTVRGDGSVHLGAPSDYMLRSLEHEVGHTLGLEDRYRDRGWLERIVAWFAGGFGHFPSESVPLPGSETNIMAEVGGMPSEQDISNIIEEALQMSVPQAHPTPETELRKLGDGIWTRVPKDLRPLNPP